MNRTNTARSSTTNVGTPNIAQRFTASVCSSASVFERPAGRDLGRDRVGVEPDRRRDLAQHVVLGDLLALVVAGRERGDVPVEELRRGTWSRTAMPHSSARTPVPRSAGSRSQTGGLVLARRAPGRARTARKRTSQSRPVAQPGDDRLVRVAGERAAVVEAHGEVGSRVLQGADLAAVQHGHHCPRDDRWAASAAPEREAERGAGDDVGGVVQPHVDAGRGDGRGQRVPARPAAEQRGRAERGGRVPGREGAT